LLKQFIGLMGFLRIRWIFLSSGISTDWKAFQGLDRMVSNGML
jgi:hypothetical protein